MENTENSSLIKCCVGCKKEFKVRSPSEMHARKYCCKACQGESSKKQVGVTCEVCNLKFSVPQCLAGTTRFCSRKCKGIEKRKIKDGSLRQCNVCEEILPIDEFYTSNSKPEYRCKKCSKNGGKKRNRTPLGRFAFAKHLAKKRNYAWLISKDKYFELVKNDCHYCGRSLDETGVGLDRKDNFGGYEPDNVVPCCGSCNAVKSSDYTYEEMLVISNAIKKVLQERTEPKNPKLRLKNISRPTQT